MKEGKVLKKIKGSILTTVMWWSVTSVITIWSFYLFFDGRTQKAFMGVLTIVSLIVLAYWQRKTRHPFPPSFMGMIYAFIFLSVGIGTFSGGYQIPHFDDVLHFFSGCFISYGAYILFMFIVGEDAGNNIPKTFIGLYLITFSLAIAGFWELLEFTGDRLFHFTASRGYEDTMVDMIDGLIGGTIVAIFLTKKHGENRKKV